MLYSLDSGFNTLDTSELKEMKEVFETKKIIIRDFYYCKTHKQIHLDFVSPIINENQKTIAVLVFRINPNDYLFPLIEKWPLPSETGESFLFRVEGDEVVYLNPLKENRNQTLSFKNTLDEKELISVKGALGLKGIVEGIDYSRQSVLADLNSIDETPWFIVSKIDQSEVYSELRYRATAIAFVVFLSLLVFTSGILLLYKYRQSNLYKELFLKEKEFSDAKEEFKTALYSIGDAVITTDINGFINHMNLVAENLTGYKESEAQGMKLEKVFKIISEDSHLDVDNPVQKILKEGTIVGLANHTLLVSKDGTKIPIADSGSPIKNTSNEIIGVVLVFRDQSEERKAEQRLKENETQFRLISNLTSDYLFSTRRNKEGEQETDWVAGAFEKITGYIVEEYKAIGGWRATLLEEDLEKDLEDFKKLEQNENVISEIRNYKKDGSIVWVRSYGHPIWDEKENRLDGIIGAVQDITESKLAEIALKKSEENYRLLVENQSDLVVKVDKEGRFQFVSPSYCKLFNKTEEELIGQSFYPLVHEDDVVPTQTAMLALYEEPYTCYIEQRALTVNGWIWIAWSDTAVLDAEGNIDYIIGVGRDINKRKLAEGRLKSSEEKFHKAFDISPDAININRFSDGLYVSINNGFSKVTGYSEDEVIGKTSEQIKI
jgi:PAS domain S-box-containing protein